MTVLFSLVLLSLAFGTGCTSTTRTVTIAASPPDATISIDGAERGVGRIEEVLSFAGGRTYTVKVARLGFTDQVIVLNGVPEQDETTIALKPRIKRVRFVVSPRLPATIRVDGKALHKTERLEASAELEFGVDANGRWIPHVATAERPGFQPAEATVRFEDATAVYTLALDPVRKDVTIVTDPPGASVFIDGVPMGPSPLHRPGFIIGADELTNAWKKYRVRAEMPGHEPAETTITFDPKTEYTLRLKPIGGTARPPTPPTSSPAVAIVHPPTTVPAAVPATTSPATRAVSPPPVTRPVTPPAPPIASADPPPVTRPATVPATVGPDVLAPVTATVEGVRPRWARGPSGWLASADEYASSAPLKTDEPGGQSLRLIVKAGEGQTIGSLATSGDGSRLAYNVLSADRDALRSKILLKRLDVDETPVPLTAGEHVDLMPAFAPGGRRVLFVGDRRADGTFGVFSAPVSPPGAPEPVPSPEAGNDAGPNAADAGTLWLWPTLDVAPEPRLYVERRAPGGGEPRVLAVETGTGKRVDLGQVGVQPRVSPRADAVVFVRADLRTGKRDLYLKRDGDPKAVNLTNSPDDDDFDPAWSKDGSRLAWTSDRTVPGGPAATSPAVRTRDLNVWVMDVATPAGAVAVTTNAAADDAPAWTGDDSAVYFRSDRGGHWGIWRVDVPGGK